MLKARGWVVMIDNLEMVYEVKYVIANDCRGKLSAIYCLAMLNSILLRLFKRALIGVIDGRRKTVSWHFGKLTDFPRHATIPSPSCQEQGE